MATVNETKGGVNRVGRADIYGKPKTVVYAILDLVDAAATKGSALATGDVIQVIGVPGNTYVDKCFVKVKELADVDTFHFDVGFGGDADLFVDEGGMDASLGSAGELDISKHQTAAVTGTTSKFTSTYDTIDVTIMTFSGTAPSTGQLVIFAELVDLTAEAGSNIADVQ